VGSQLSLDWQAPSEPSRETIGDGATLLHGFAAEDSVWLWQTVNQIAAAAPFRHMVTPGGFRMSVAMTNCGPLGWVSDERGYRYQELDPLSGSAWPAMPSLFTDLAARAADAAGFPEFDPDACLINRYEPGARLTLHQDRNERDLRNPIVSVSLGLPAVFLFGGDHRREKIRRFCLQSGDIAVWGGASRLAFHGVAPLEAGEHPLTGECRINLTFRRAA
jgi:alkylated DNA repair protein (DNA oxidative demethylase)